MFVWRMVSVSLQVLSTSLKKLKGACNPGGPCGKVLEPLANDGRLGNLESLETQTQNAAFFERKRPETQALAPREVFKSQKMIAMRFFEN